MKQEIVLFSGPIAVGKSTLCKNLESNFDFRKISSGEYLRINASQKNLELSRENLQALGDQFDEETDFEWIVKDVSKPILEENADHGLWFVDAVRKRKQVEHFKAAFSHVCHVHLTAREDILLKRYNQRNTDGEIKEGITLYAEAVNHPNEQAARGLIRFADHVIDLSNTSPSAAAELVFNLIEGK